MSEQLRGEHVFGSELEYGCIITPVPGMRYILEDDEDYVLNARERQYSLLSDTLHSLRRTYPPGLVERREFLSNGGKLYLDLEHIEYATPECASLDDYVATQLAGDKIVTWMLIGLLERGRAEGFQLYRRLVDTGVNSWGFHVNHQVPNDTFGEMGIHIANIDRLMLLGIHNATHGSYTGAGYIQDNEYWLTQKGSRTDIDFSDATVDKKPVVNLRNESLADNQYLRVHSVSGDTVHSPWAIKMQAGTTALVLKLIRAGATADSLNIRPTMPLHKLMKVVGSDITMNQVAEIEGRSDQIRPLDMQHTIYSACTELPSLSGDDRWVLREWDKVLADLDRDPRSTHDRVQWAAKLQEVSNRVPDHDKHTYIQDGTLKYDNMRTAEQALGVDGNFDLVAKTAVSKRTGKLIIAPGYGPKWCENEWRDDTPAEEKIEFAITNSPEDTRAAIRGRAIIEIAQKFDHEDYTALASWESLRIGRERISYGAPQNADTKILKRISHTLSNTYPRRIPSVTILD